SAQAVVTEMGERMPGDLALLCDVARPNGGVITNVGLAHAAHLGGPDGVAAVLSELLEALPADGIAVLNADDPWTSRLAQRTDAKVVTVGPAAQSDYRVADIEVDEQLRATFRVMGQRVMVPLRGEHHAVNAAMAFAVAHAAFQRPVDEIAVELAAATT